MYRRKTNLEKAAGVLRLVRKVTRHKIRKIASMYDVKINDLKPLLKG